MVRPNPPTKALILAAHGCSRGHGVSVRLDRIAAQLRIESPFDSVTPSYHKQPPYFREVLDGLSADQVVVVPFMTSQGYFCRRVLPRKLGLIGPRTRRPGQTVHLTSALGTHAHLPQLIADQVRSTLRAHRLDASSTAVVLVGHGTTRDDQSAQLTERHAESLRRQHVVAQIHTAYLDQQPELETIYSMTDLPSLIVVPYLIGGGRHDVEDIPNRLGMGSVASRRVHVCPSPFEDPGIGDLVLDLAVQALDDTPADSVGPSHGPSGTMITGCNAVEGIYSIPRTLWLIDCPSCSRGHRIYDDLSADHDQT